jgi:hypothetical protein
MQYIEHNTKKSLLQLLTEEERPTTKNKIDHRTTNMYLPINS